MPCNLLEILEAQPNKEHVLCNLTNMVAGIRALQSAGALRSATK